MPLLDAVSRRFGVARRGEGSRRTREAIELAKIQVTRFAWQRVQANLRGGLQHPTGHYQGRVIIDRAAGDLVVTDQGAVYGPWLEGTGSRNYPVTKFRGYASFRRAARETEVAARRIVERALGQRLGGR